MIEVLFVLMIAAVLTSLGMRQWGRIQVQHQVSNARDALVYMGIRAQSAAMKRGNLVRIEIWPDTNMAKIVTPSDSAIERIRFDSQFGVQVFGSSVVACYSARGFALPSCTTGVPATISFVVHSDTARATVLPLGQIEKDP